MGIFKFTQKYVRHEVISFSIFSIGFVFMLSQTPSYLKMYATKYAEKWESKPSLFNFLLKANRLLKSVVSSGKCKGSH